MRLLLIVGVLLLVGANYYAAVRSVGTEADVHVVQAALLDAEQTLDADRKQFDAERVALLDDMAKLEAQVLEKQTGLQASVEKETALRSELEQARSDLEIAQSTQGATTQEHEDLLTQIASQNAEMTTLNTQLSDAQAIIEDLKAGVQEQQQETDLLRKQLADAKQKAETVTAQLAALSEETPTLPAPAASDAEIASLKEVIGEKNTLIKAFVTRIDKMTADADEQALALSSTMSKVESLGEEVSSLRDDNSALLAEVVAVRADKDTLTDVLSQRDGEIEELRASIPVPVVQTVESCTDETSSLLADNNINFRTGTNRIAESSFGILENLAAVAVNCMSDDLVVTIGGHTDSLGAVTDNQRLSENRADAVRSFFAARGLPAEAMQVVGYGEADPVADNATPEGRAQNRRVTFEWQQRGSL